MTPKAPIRVIIADDHLLFRQGLKSLLRQEADVVIVGEAERAADLPFLLAHTGCDVLVLDVQMERSALADIEILSRQVSVLVLTASEVPADAVAAIRNGARAVVFKRFAVETLMQALRTMVSGNVWLPPSLQTYIAGQLRNPATQALSVREQEVVRYVAAGLRNAEVARKMGISEQTVKTHLNSIFRKLGVRDRLELVLYVSQAGGRGDPPRR